MNTMRESLSSIGIEFPEARPDVVVVNDALFKAYALESAVQSKVRVKFDKVIADSMQATEHRLEIRTWAAIADQAMHRQHVYHLRKEWAAKCIAAGLCDSDEAYTLAKLRFKL